MDIDALYAAAMAGDADAISKLDIEADKLDNNKKNILQIESTNGNVERVRFILRQFASKNLLVNLNYHNESAIFSAASRGYTEVVKILIEAARRLPWASLSADNDTRHNPVTSFQAFIRKHNTLFCTALGIAVRNARVDVVKLLVEADPNDRHIQNHEGKTPMYMAAEQGHKNIIEFICTTCAAQSVEGPGGSTVLHALIKDKKQASEKYRSMMSTVINAVKRWSSGEDALENSFETLFNKIDDSGRNVLDLAVERDNLDAAKLILVEDPAYGHGSKRNHLMRLIFKVTDKNNKDLFDLFSRTYQDGIDSSHQGVLDLILAIKNRDKVSILHMLGDNKQLSCFEDDKGWTLLHFATFLQFDLVLEDIINTQIECGYKFVYRNTAETPFDVALKYGYTSTLIRLMEIWPASSCAYISLNNKDQNLLHLAAVEQKGEMIQGIIKYCAEEYRDKIINQQDVDGDTPLHILISKGCYIPELIQHKGLDTLARNKDGLTPRDMLYIDDNIIDKQVEIKMMLDEVQTNQKEDILGSRVSQSLRHKKDEKFNERAELIMLEKKARMKQDIERYKSSHGHAQWFADAIDGNAIAKAALEIQVDEVNEEGETILHVESKKGVMKNVRFIMSEFANKGLLGKLDNLKQTALHLAAHHGNTQVVESLIDAARHLPSSLANDDARNPVSSFQDFIRRANGQPGNTALHLAVLKNKVAIVKLLVEADPNDSHVQNNEGKTPICIAAENGYEDIVKEICTTCTALSLEGPGGRTALHAVINNIGQVKEGANNMIRMMVHAAKHWSSAEDPSLVKFEALFSTTDESECTVLQLAMEKNYVDAVKLILQEDPAYQPGLEIKRNGIMCLIYRAIDKKYSEDIIELLSEAYEAGMDSDHKGVLALILDIKKRDEDSVLGHLKEDKKLVTFQEDNGWTPLHYAVYHEFDSILSDIIQAQKEIGHQFVYKNTVSTPFQVAVKHGYTSTLIRLMQSWPASSFAVTAAVNEIGQNILHLAAAGNNKVMVQGILKFCSEEFKEEILKQQDNNGDTPLHLLIKHGCFIPELIEHERLETTNKNKYTPPDMLYFRSDVVAEQVHIKIALDELQTNQSAQNLWTRSTAVPPSKQSIKNVIFDERIAEHKKLLMDEEQGQKKKDLEKYKLRTNTQIIVTALITTVTFTVGFTMPGGLRQSGEVEEGLVLLSKKNAFNVFMVSDALALLLSTSSLFFYFLESMNDDPQQVAKLNTASTVLNIISVVAMMLTFIAGTYVVLSHSPVLAITVCVIGSLFFLLIIVLSIKVVYDRQVKRKKNFKLL